MHLARNKFPVRKPRQATFTAREFRAEDEGVGGAAPEFPLEESDREVSLGGDNDIIGAYEAEQAKLGEFFIPTCGSAGVWAPSRSYRVLGPGPTRMSRFMAAPANVSNDDYCRRPILGRHRRGLYERPRSRTF